MIKNDLKDIPNRAQYFDSKAVPATISTGYSPAHPLNQDVVVIVTGNSSSITHL